MKTITDDQLNRFGMMVDSVVSARSYTTTGMLPPEICLEAIDGILKELSGDARELYVEISGSDLWADHPREIQP